MASLHNNKQRSLQHGLTSRQVSMISIAGIIGAGLFIGSSNAIATAGPAILISYAMTGLLVLLVMRMLGEMAIANPNSGSFSTYASEAIGPWAGFTIGWLYWWFWVLIIQVEAIDISADERRYRVTGQLFFVSKVYFVQGFDLHDHPSRITIDLSSAHIWDQSGVAALDQVIRKFRLGGSEVSVEGLNQESLDLFERIGGQESAHA